MISTQVTDQFLKSGDLPLAEVTLKIILLIVTTFHMSGQMGSWVAPVLAFPTGMLFYFIYVVLDFKVVFQIWGWHEFLLT